MTVNTSRHKEWLLFILILALWICCRPYNGIWHDAVIYTGQALHLLAPDDFTNDLFFIYGSQDKYTIFTNLYAYLISHIGISSSSLVLTVIGQAIWLTGAFLLSRKVLPFPFSWISLAAIIIFPFYYSVNDIFRAGESFLTPRIFAEGLSMLALAAMLEKKYFITGLAIIIAGLLHPLNAIPAALLVFFYFALDVPKTAVSVLAVSGTIFLVFAIMGVSPFNALLRPIDPEWFSITSGRSPWLYSNKWPTTYWNLITITASLLSLIALKAHDGLARVCKAGFMMLVTTIFVTYFASETLSSTLLIQLQTWRSLWLAFILVCFASIWIIWKTHNRELNPEIVVGYLAALLHLDSYGGVIAALVTAYAMSPLQNSDTYRKWARLLLISIFVLGAIEFLLLKLNYYSMTLPVTFAQLSLSKTPLSLARAALYATITITIGIVALKKFNKNDYKVYALIGISLLIISVDIWDTRSDLTPWENPDQSQLEIIDNLIARNETVLWGSDSPVTTWLLLNRPSYYSEVQASGTIFNRRTAVEAYRRFNSIAPLYDDSSIMADRMKYGIEKERPSLQLSDLQKICANKDLGWLVLKEKFQGYKATYIIDQYNTWYFYQCSDLRNKLTTSNRS